MRDILHAAHLLGIGLIGSFEVSTQDAETAASWALALLLAGGLIAGCELAMWRRA